MKAEFACIDYCLRDIVSCFGSGSYDYVAVALTPWHARMVVSCYLKLKSSGQVKSGVLLIDRHNKDGFLISPETVIASGLDVAYLGRSDSDFIAFVCRVLLPSLQSRKTSGRVVYFANPSFPGSVFDNLAVFRLDCRISYILIDEGVGSYLSSVDDWIRRSIDDCGFRGGKAIVRRWLGCYEQRRLPAIVKKLKKDRRYNKFYLFRNDGEIDSDSAVWLQRYLKISAERRKPIFKSYNKCYEGAVVYCSQYPLVQSGSISLAAHLESVEAAFRVSKELEVPFVIKLHPRETDLSVYGKFEAEIDSRYGIALEEVLGSLDKPPLCVASLCSTVMISASALFDCRCIGLSNLVLGEGVSENFVQFCKRMKDVFGSYYFRPATIGEFCAYLTTSA